MKVSEKYAQYLIIKSQVVCIYKSFYFILSLFKTKQKQPGKKPVKKETGHIINIAYSYIYWIDCFLM